MYHIVKRGESLWSIAKDHHVTLQELLAVNPQIKDPNLIMIGEKILLPPGAGHVDIPGMPLPPIIDEVPDTGGPGNSTDVELCKQLAALPRPLIYVVRRGDTLAQIAECFELPTQELLRVNPQIKNVDTISPGDKVFIPRPRAVIFPPIAPLNNAQTMAAPDAMPTATFNTRTKEQSDINEKTCPFCGHRM